MPFLLGRHYQAEGLVLLGVLLLVDAEGMLAHAVEGHGVDAGRLGRLKHRWSNVQI